MTDRILLVQLADIGDLVLTTPAIAALRVARPSAHLALLTTDHAAPLVNGTALVDAIYTVEKQSALSFFQPQTLRRIFSFGNFDTVVFFHHFTLKSGTLKFEMIARAVGAPHRLGLQNGNGWFLTASIPDHGFGAKHQAQYWLDLVGLLGAESTPRPAQIRVDAPPALPGHPGKTVIIHAGSGGYSRARRWDPVKFAAVADALQHEGQRVILVGSAGDDADTVQAAMQTPVHNLSGHTPTLSTLAGLIQSADLFIGADSGVMHIAAAVGVPIVAIFGPSNHAAWRPWTPASPSVVLRSAPVCSPCSYVAHGIGLREGCPARTCMRMVTAETVLTAAHSLLQGEDPPIQHQPVVAPVNRPWTRIQILGLPVDGITYDQWLDLIAEWVREDDRAHQVCTTNPEFSMIAQTDSNFRNILKRADLCVPDGVGLLWAARRLGTPLPERVTGSDGVPRIAAHAAQTGWRLYLLGAAPGIAEKAAEILRDRYPGVQIAGTYAGSPAPEEEDAIVERINASGADLLFVAYGAPRQDAWIARNLPRLNVAMAMGVGGAFDFIAGVIPRAPDWMRRAGIEWLYRLYLEPRRIGRMMRLPRFVLAVLRRGEA
jgi:N-acetylglucosaminyldiphosphoundecaprenol N-acetyl-beta-D-mannosaminyltransferase